jgi:hypothetical protein
MGKVSRKTGRSKESLSKVTPWRDGGRVPADSRQPKQVEKASSPLSPEALAARAALAPVRAEAVEVARRVATAHMGLIDGARALRDLLARLGEFEAGEFAGEFSGLSYFCFETDPYPSESQRASWSEVALAEADRWLPTLVSNHRAKVLGLCRRVIEKHS